MLHKPTLIKEDLKMEKPGTEINGGFFAGVIAIDGKHYGVIVAPKAEGEFKGEWCEYGKKIAATSIADGHKNSQAMAEAGSEIATRALALDISGYQDWYIPSRDELELMYRNLKPTARNNLCSFRDGENPSSVPRGAFYKDEAPKQTEAKNFQEGGSEALEGWYWSSTQYSAYGAFSQDFSDGGQGHDGKDCTLRVRAVRRFLIN